MKNKYGGELRVAFVFEEDKGEFVCSIKKYSLC